MTIEATGHHIYWVGGSKGGVGKSMLTIATLDYLLARSRAAAPHRVRHE